MSRKLPSETDEVEKAAGKLAMVASALDSVRNWIRNQLK